MKTNSNKYLIELRNLSKVFYDSKKYVYALNRISLKIEKGEFVVIVGPSGCGKSTLLRCIAGLEQPSDGEIFIKGIISNNTPPEDRFIEWLPQNIELTFLSNKTVYYNLGVGLRIRKVPKKEQDKKIQKVASLLEISHLLDRFPTEISGGELQRVAIGRAMMRDSNIFLFDEPLSNLDELRRRELRLEFSEIKNKVNGSFIYVTHDQREALSIGTRCVVMNSGHIEQDCTPEEVYYNPRNLFVAKFFSQNGLNEFPCEATFNQNTCFIKSHILNFSFPLKHKQENRTISAILCIRAEDILAKHKNKRSENEISLGQWKLLNRYFLGNETFIITIAESNKHIKAIAKWIECNNQDTAELFANIKHIYLFDANTFELIGV